MGKILFGQRCPDNRGSTVWLFYVIALILGFLPLLYVSINTLKWIVHHRKFGFEEMASKEERLCAAVVNTIR